MYSTTIQSLQALAYFPHLEASANLIFLQSQFDPEMIMQAQWLTERTARPI